MREVRWERMFPDELESAIAACPVVYFAYGLCEPQGPHNAVGLAALKAHAICCRAAREHGGLVAPPDYWHVHEVGLYAAWASEWVGEVRPWLSALPPWVHFKNICYHVRAADALGFQAAILLTGHYGPNWEDLKTLLRLLQPHFAMRLFGLPDFEANSQGFDGASGDHAGKVETSLLWALAPDCVDMSRLPDERTGSEPNFAMGPDAHLADRRIGERMVDDEVSWLGNKARELLAEYAAQPNRGQNPRSFLETEEMWSRDILPRLSDFQSMQYLDREAPPTGSRWELNYVLPQEGTYA